MARRVNPDGSITIGIFAEDKKVKNEEPIKAEVKEEPKTEEVKEEPKKTAKKSK